MHGESVGHYAAITAENLGLPPARVRPLRLAGVLHDIGKVAISDSILDKPGRLTPEEWAEVRRHPEIGYRLISSAGLPAIGGWVLSHHERPDGSGYPYGLTGTEIPLESMILSAADAYHAMLERRPYKAPVSPADAASELRRCASSQFDATVVEALVGALETSIPRAVGGSERRARAGARHSAVPTASMPHHTGEFQERMTG